MIKYDTLRKLVKKDKDMLSVIPLNRLFDPTGFLSTFLWEYAIEYNISICELNIELI